MSDWWTDARTDRALLELLKRAAFHVMTLEERRAQRLSFIRGQTGATTERVLAVLPELAP